MSNDAIDSSPSTPEGVSELAARVMRRQAALSLRVAAVFVLLLVALPLLNLFYPAAMSTDEYGFPLNWLILAVLFYPFTWILSAYFVRRSNDLEASIVESEQGAR